MDSDGRKQFGAYLRALRNEKGLSIRVASEQAELSSAYLTQIERGLRNPPSADILGRLADVYQVRQEEVMREAGYLKDNEKPLLNEEIDRAFRYVCEDPEFSFGTRLTNQVITPEAKATIVMLYQQLNGKVILKPKDVDALIEGN